MLEFPKIQADSLDGSSCSSFYNSGVWKKSKAKRDAAFKTVEKAKGSLTTASAGLVTAVKAAASAVKKCQCGVKKLHEASLLKANADAVTANEKAWTKAAHLRCVIDGKSTSQCTVPSIPKVKAVAVEVGVKNVNCNPQKLVNDKCNGIRYCKNAIAEDQVMLFQTYQNSKWDPNRVYTCPDGYYWASSSQYKSTYSKIGSCASPPGGGGYTMYNQCGWKGYNDAGAGTYHTYYRFTNSKSTGCYQNVGSPTSLVCNGDKSTGNFAGIVCLKKGYSGAGGNYNPSGGTWGAAPTPTACSLNKKKC